MDSGDLHTRDTLLPLIIRRLLQTRISDVEDKAEVHGTLQTMTCDNAHDWLFVLLSRVCATLARFTVQGVRHVSRLLRCFHARATLSVPNIWGRYLLHPPQGKAFSGKLLI